MIDVAAEVFGVILLKKFQSERGQRTTPNQSGCRLGRGCTGQMHNLRRTLEKRWSFQQTTVMCFVDFASAFNSVDRNSLWQIIAAYGMRAKLLRLIKAYYGRRSGQVGVTHCLLRFAPAFDKDVHCRLPSSATSLESLPRGSGWRQRPCVRPRLCRRNRNTQQ